VFVREGWAAEPAKADLSGVPRALTFRQA
jgi:hypothetical protein